MDTILEKLKSYLENHSKDEILNDWAKTKKYDQSGPSVDWFLEYTMNINQEVGLVENYWEFSSCNYITENLEFTSDFFYFSKKIFLDESSYILPR